MKRIPANLVLDITLESGQRNNPKPSISAISAFSQSLTELLPQLGSDRFSSLLIETVRGLVPVDEARVIVYETASLPFLAFTDPDAWAQPNLDTFLKSAFLLDPYYVAATRENKSGFFRLRDECGYLVPLQGGGFMNISLGRISTRNSRKFCSYRRKPSSFIASM